VSLEAENVIVMICNRVHSHGVIHADSLLQKA